MTTVLKRPIVPVIVRRLNGRVYAHTVAPWGDTIQHVVKHSPTGMEFGYGGSGPSDLARSILLHFAHEVVPADYQGLKWDVIAKLSGDGPHIIQVEQLALHLVLSVCACYSNAGVHFLGCGCELTPITPTMEHAHGTPTSH